VKPLSATRENGTDAGLERIKRLEEQRALAPVNGAQHRTLRAAIRLEAVAYRKTLDVEQAAAMHETRCDTLAARNL
jgi:hypothetical protein